MLIQPAVDVCCDARVEAAVGTLDDIEMPRGCVYLGVCALGHGVINYSCANFKSNRRNLALLRRFNSLQSIGLLGERVHRVEDRHRLQHWAADRVLRINQIISDSRIKLFL